MVVAGVQVVSSPRVDQGDVLVVNALDRVHMVADDLIATSLVLGAGAAARVEGAVVVGVGVDAIVTDDAPPSGDEATTGRSSWMACSICRHSESL